VKRIFRTVAALLTAGLVLAPSISASAALTQWHLSFLRVDAANAINEGQGVIVAVVDSGVDAENPDLKGSVLSGADFVSPALSPDGRVDGDGHGTGMAGLIAAHGQVRGVAPRASILPIRVLDDTGTTTQASIGRAIDYAVDQGAMVINVSIGGDIGGPNEEAAVERAIANNVVVVAGAGNTTEGSTAVGYPAAVPGVVAVVGVDKHGVHASLSVSGPEAVIAAPAVDIVSSDIRAPGHDGYRTGNGTSDAAAIVSGVVALIRSKYPKLSAAEVVHRLTATADDKGAPGRDPIYGYGIVDPVRALTADVPPLTPSATPAPSSQPTGAGPGITRPVIVVALAAFVILLLVVIGVVVRRRTIST
jgi:type VII secretion-associated serine protease mycosin